MRSRILLQQQGNAHGGKSCVGVENTQAHTNANVSYIYNSAFRLVPLVQKKNEQTQELVSMFVKEIKLRKLKAAYSHELYVIIN